jgi:hypothetical protein
MMSAKPPQRQRAEAPLKVIQQCTKSSISTSYQLPTTTMLRQTFFNSTSKCLLASMTKRALSVSSVRMAEGSTGGMRAGGEAAG